jgi:diadenosine tetraphosphatase ApaH/serine/threonine PP2A family protein phosphatase
MYNPVHGQMRYMRMTANDREIAIAGDSHVPVILQYEEGGNQRTAINCGSIQNGGYGKRFFSLLNSPVFPCFRLSGKNHSIVSYWSVKESL